MPACHIAGMSDPSPSFVRNDAVLFSEVGSDIVALSIAKGECFGMEDVTAEVWRMLASPMTLSAICERLIQAYDVDGSTCIADVAELISDMRQKGLVVTADRPS